MPLWANCNAPKRLPAVGKMGRIRYIFHPFYPIPLQSVRQGLRSPGPQARTGQAEGGGRVEAAAEAEEDGGGQGEEERGEEGGGGRGGGVPEAGGCEAE